MTLLKSLVQSALGSVGLSLHRKEAVDRLVRELGYLRILAAGQSGDTPPPKIADITATAAEVSSDELKEILQQLAWFEARRGYLNNAQDEDAPEKRERILTSRDDFGQSDFAELACCMFGSNLSNHGDIHQRFDEAGLLWRAVKTSGGPILEVGRATGGSTVLLLGASGSRPVISIDRAPIHGATANVVFERPDVKRRLRLYTQTSREPINETEFGMLFVDGDHSYEGVCHDIASYWNSLKSFDGKPPIAAFHDAVYNPIGYVEAVKRACDELLAERKVVRVVETWGALLVVEKIGDIDQSKWYAKADRRAWSDYPVEEGVKFSPNVIEGRLDVTRPRPNKSPLNLLRNENVDHQAWVKTGVEVHRVFAGLDNAVRFVSETTVFGPHGISYQVPVNAARFGATIFVRPVRRPAVRLAILEAGGKEIAEIDFHLGNSGHLANAATAEGVEILDAGFLFQNGFYRCDLSVAVPRPLPSISVAINSCRMSDGNGQSEVLFPGGSRCGFIFNMASVREIL